MGASQGNTNKLDSNIKKEEELSKGILEMAKQLYKQYHTQFTNVSLCDQMVIVAADKLHQFDKFTLKKISEKQNSKNITLKPVFISKNSNQGSLFEIENMPDIPDYFYNKFISIPQGIDKNGEKFTSRSL